MENAKRYLYGAAVQGIQGFIFQTNELKDIVGASDIVHHICTNLFNQCIDDNRINNGMPVVNAAGNIKYEFENREACEKVVREFPKRVLELAPGITISQAVVEYDGTDFKSAVDKLEQRLRIQRNKPMKSATIGLTGIKRSAQTGLPLIVGENNKGKEVDAATAAKRLKKNNTLNLCKNCFGIDTVRHEYLPYDIGTMTGQNDWIAIIHADGNGLGQVIQRIGKDKKALQDFSVKLEGATKAAAHKAFNEIKEEVWDKSLKKYQLRPIVLGGDDLTVICRGDLALKYTRAFLQAFEEETGKAMREILEKAGIASANLTACAGIAYVKSSFPFYYGYDLAEELCKYAKKDAKRNLSEDGNMIPDSCLMFHKVQDSFIESYNEICRRELTPHKNHSFCFGPYYLSGGNENSRWRIEDLMDKCDTLKKEEAKGLKSHLRQWLSLMHDNLDMATQKMIRVKSLIDNPETNQFIGQLTSGEKRSVKDEEGKEQPINCYSAYDILSLFSVMNQETK